MALSSTTSRRSPIAAGVVLGAAVGLVGTSFGLFAVTSGLSTPQACALSLLTFTGASQFALVSAVAAGGTPIAAVGSALLLGARNGVYGLAMSRVITGSLPRRLVAAQLVLDESTALAMAQPERSDQQRAFWSAGISVFVCWNLGTVIGALVGSKIGSPDAWGLDAAFPAGFVALLAPHVRKVGGWASALLGAMIALVLIPLTPPGLPILAATAATLVGLRST